MCYDTVTVSW